MFSVEKNTIVIDGKSFEFENDIRQIIQHGDKFIVLLAIPFNDNTINNVYCLDDQAKVIWRSEDLNSRFPELKNYLPYEQMQIKDDIIFASDFYGRSFSIRVTDGIINDFAIVK